MDVETITEFFMWCMILSGGIYIYSVIMCIVASDFMYRFHKRWFHVTREAFNIAIYSYLGLFKIVFILFFLVPYIALLIVA